MSENMSIPNPTALVDKDFNGWDNEPAIPIYNNSELYGNSFEKERIIVESKGSIIQYSRPNPFNVKKLPKTSISYLKRNWIFLTIVFAIWLALGVESYGTLIYKIPIVSQIYGLLNSTSLRNILIYFTATYNGPVGFFDGGLNFYTFLVAVTGKSTYLLAMTGVVIPSMKALIKNKSNEINNYKIISKKAVEIVKQLPNNFKMLGFAITGCGAALVFSNLLTRNGKIDKTFVLVLLSFVLLKGLNRVLPSALDFIARRLIVLFTYLIPGEKTNVSMYKEVLRVGAALGFLFSIIIGSIGENIGYILGTLLLVVGVIVTIVKKEMI